jgi:hypothetical protein
MVVLHDFYELRNEKLLDEDEFREMRRIFCNIFPCCETMDDLEEPISLAGVKNGRNPHPDHWRARLHNFQVGHERSKV